MDLLRDDRVLLDAFRRGDEAALHRVYYAYAEDVFTFLRRGFPFCARKKPFAFNGYKQPWQLESAVQDVFLKAFTDRARRSYDGQHPFKSYLFTIARNMVIDRFRKSPTGRLDVRELKDIDDRELIWDRPPTPEQAAVNKELEDAVARFVESLEAEMRAFFELRFVEGGSLEEAAKRLGVSDYRVKRYERHIKKRFFFYMKERGYFKGYGYRELGMERILVSVLFACGARWGC